MVYHLYYILLVKVELRLIPPWVGVRRVSRLGALHVEYDLRLGQSSAPVPRYRCSAFPRNLR